MLSGSLSPWHGASSGCRWTREPPDVEVSHVYTKQGLVDNQQGMMLQSGGLARSSKNSPLKTTSYEMLLRAFDLDEDL